ncbi:MAG: hypothetical protein M3303_05455 [Gemmatimonadota bacterium]|nr:hypothetical protein [Gemmatimonadota bacterium]
MPRAHLAAIVAALVGTITPASAQYGDLAPGGALTWSLAGVHVEVSVTFAMAPTFTQGRVPRGFQPFTLREVAAGGDTAARATLAAHPDFASHVVATLNVARLDSMVVEGDTAAVRPLTVAFWWVPVQLADSSAALPDARARPGGQLVELGLWSADARFGRRLGAVMSTAVAAPLTVTWDGAGRWRIRLMIPDGNIVGSCRPIGTATAMEYRLPAYSTVWAADSTARAFSVFTYYGHRAQRCRGFWRATGDAALAQALRTGAILGVDNQIGWRARAAAYAPR